MKALALLSLVVLVACQPHAHSSATPAPAPLRSFVASEEISGSRPIATGTLTKGVVGGIVSVDVHNAYALHDVNVDVQDFCGQPFAHGPMQPYNLILGYGQTSGRVSSGRVTGLLPPSCFSGPAKTINVVYNEDDYQVICTLEIAPNAFGFTFTKTLQGPHAQCSLAVASPFQATFTFNATTPKGQLSADFPR